MFVNFINAKNNEKIDSHNFMDIEIMKTISYCHKGDFISDDDSFFWEIEKITVTPEKYGPVRTYYMRQTLEKNERSIEQKIRDIIGNKKVRITNVYNDYNNGHTSKTEKYYDIYVDNQEQYCRRYVTVSTKSFSWTFSNGSIEWQNEIIDKLVNNEFEIV